jgi:hypothetical protein
MASFLQIHYMLGDSHGGINPNSGQPYFSYVIGYGDNFPRVRWLALEIISARTESGSGRSRRSPSIAHN